MAHGSGPSPERRRAGCGMAATVCVRYSFPMRQAACATDIRRGAAGIAEALAREPGPAATPEAIAGIVRRLDQSEYKRRQAPLVLRVSPKAFGAGRRLPIVHRYAL